jgi:hypothetical protein
VSFLENVAARYRVGGNPLQTERRLELTGVILVLLFLLQLIYSGIRLARDPSPDVVAPAADALRLDASITLNRVNSEQSEEIRARPLFWASRRPQRPAGTPPSRAKQEALAQLDGVKLQGVFGSDETAGIIALVKGKKQRILLGETIEGWTLKKVKHDRVILADGKRRSELMLTAGVITSPIQPVEESRTIPTPDSGAAPRPREKKTGGSALKPQPAPLSSRRGVSRGS